MIKKISSLILMLLLLSGCWSQQELDKKTYVVAIGLDKAEESKVRVTYLIVNPEYGTTPEGGSGNARPFSIVSFLADDIFIAKGIANTIISKDISYTILNQLFVSEDFAKSNDFIRWLYDTTKETEIRKDIGLAVTKESSYDFLSNFKPKLEEKPYRYFREKIEDSTKTGLIPSNSELFYYFRVTEADQDLFLSIYSTHEDGLQQEPGGKQFLFDKDIIKPKGDIDKTQYLGSAVFKNGKMIGTLSGQETILTTLLQSNYRSNQNIYHSFTDPLNEKYKVTTRLNMFKKTKVSMDLNKGKPEMKVTMPIAVDVYTNHSMTEYYKRKDKQEKLRKTIEKHLDDDYEALIKRTQEEFGTDPFGWSLIAQKQFRTNKEYNDFDWVKHYPNMKITFEAKVTLKSFGRQSGISNLKQIRED